MLARLLEVVEQGIVEVDVAFLLEVAGQLVQDQLVERGAAVDALDLGLHQFVEVGDRGVEVDRRVEQQHALEVETAPGFVQMADERRIQGAEAVTAEVILGNRQARMLRTHALHDPVQVFGVITADAGGGEA
ncbi:hypothetical protein D3C76_1354010 [compost metagenome]